MPVYLDKKTKRYFIQFQKDGYRYKERLPKGMKLADANAIELQMRHRLAFQKHGIATDSDMPTFEQFVMQVYLPTVDGTASYEKAVYVCKAALAFLKGKRLDDILEMHIQEFRRSREALLTQHDTKRKPATVARELSILSKVFAIAVKNGIIDENPVRKVKLPKFDNMQHRVLSFDEEQRLFDHISSEWVRDVCRFALLTGLRQNDIMNLTPFQVDLPNRIIRLVQGKTRRRLDVFLSDGAAEILERRMRRNVQLLFASPVTGKNTGSVRHSLLRACKQIGIPPITIRDLRRTYSTRLLDKGWNAVAVAASLGHSDMRMIMRYANTTETRRKMAESLDNRAKPLHPAQLRKVK